MTAVLFLLACGLPEFRTQPVTGTVAVRFPHAEGYEAGAQHGAESFAAGLDTCLGCHREDSTAPTCASCHESWPHPEGWLAGSVHGEGLGGEAGVAGQAECQECHGQPGLSASACSSCHSSYPHPKGWELGGQHGSYALARGSVSAACGSCHGGSLEGTATAPSCTSCHSGWPHPEGWSEPKAHGAADPSGCESCHGTGGSGGSSEVACARCHSTYPHGDDWLLGHMSAATTVGEMICLDCHDAGEGPATVPAACGATCHGSVR